MKKRDDSGIRTLLGDLEQDIRALSPLVVENEQAALRIALGAKVSLDYAALGYTIHNIYCLMENYFLRIAKTFENNVEGDAWHRDLVRRMLIQVEGIRPAFLDDEAARVIDELRAFRHVFRNVYLKPLVPKKIMELQEQVPKAIDLFKARHAEFAAKLRLMLED